MKFTVYVDDGDGNGVYEYGEYRGASNYTLADSGALVVRPEGGGRVTFGPAGWSRVEEGSGRVEEDSEGGGDYDVDDSIGWTRQRVRDRRTGSLDYLPDMYFWAVKAEDRPEYEEFGGDASFEDPHGGALRVIARRATTTREII